MKLLCGRFQPFHKGHLYAYETSGADAIGLVVRKSGIMDKNNPFTQEQREKIIKWVLPNVKIYKIPSLYLPAIENIVGDAVEIVVGDDRIAIKEQYEDVIIVNRIGDISSTKVREALRNNDKDKFYEFMPKQVPFDILLNWINNYDES